MYIYLTTNLINQKIYIGKCCKNWNNSLTYLGSGVYLNCAIKCYGKENFKKELICYCKDKHELNKMEIFFIDYYDSTNPLIGYNLTNGGDGGDLYFWIKENDQKRYKEMMEKLSKRTKNRKQSLEHIEKRIIKNTGKKRTKEQRKIMSIAQLNKPPMTEETKNKIGLKNTGKKRTEETKEKMRQKRIGTRASEETKEKMRIARLKYLEKRNTII